MRRFPPYPKAPHKSGAARIKIDGKDVWLGPWDSPKSWERYRAIFAQWKPGQVVDTRPPSAVTVLDITTRFYEQAAQHYGTESSEYRDYRLSLLPLNRLYGSTLASEFGPKALMAVREAMISGIWLTSEEKERRRRNGNACQVSRKVVNQRIGRIKRAFKWAVREELIDVAVYQRLLTVTGLQAGRTTAKEYPPVEPVSLETVEATLPGLPPTVRGMVQIQLLTGMRPGEVCAMLAADIDRQGVESDGVRVWVYRPERHKTAHRGHAKFVVLGPRAQAILTPHLERGGQHVFVNRVGNPYNPASYDRRIRLACKALGVPGWHPHQLRHTAEVSYEREGGLDVARAVLGHRDPRMTIRYGQQDLSRAAKAAAKIG